METGKKPHMVVCDDHEVNEDLQVALGKAALELLIEDAKKAFCELVEALNETFEIIIKAFSEMMQTPEFQEIIQELYEIALQVEEDKSRRKQFKLDNRCYQSKIKRSQWIKPVRHCARSRC